MLAFYDMGGYSAFAVGLDWVSVSVFFKQPSGFFNRVVFGFLKRLG